MAGAHLNVDDMCARVMRLLRQAEREAERFGRRAGISCPQGCGECCLVDGIEASPLSLLPLAMAAMRSGRAESLLEETKTAPETICMFHTAASPYHCAIYRLRPLICRLFGFAGRRNKHGVVEFRPCRHMLPPARSGPLPPLFSTWHLRLQGIYPPLAEIMHLHHALRRVLLWLLLLESLDHSRPPRGRAA